MDAERCIVKFTTQGLDVLDEELEAFDLHLGAREAVEDDAVAELRFEQAAEQESDDLAIADHAAGVLDAFGLGRVEQGADDDRLAGEPAGLEDEIGVGAFAGAGSAAEEDDFLGEAEVYASDARLEGLPGGGEDDLGVLDFEVTGRRGAGNRGGGGRTFFAGGDIHVKCWSHV